MSDKLIYGKYGHLRFENVEEKREALEYLATSPDVRFTVEDNDKQGAWAKEKRILFYSEVGVPECLKRQWTKGNRGILGRINAGDFWDEAMALRERG